METQVQTWISPFEMSNIQQENNSLGDFPPDFSHRVSKPWKLHMFYRTLQKVAFTLIKLQEWVWTCPNPRWCRTDFCNSGNINCALGIYGQIWIRIHSYKKPPAKILTLSQILIAGMAGRVLPCIFPISEIVKSFEYSQIPMGRTPCISRVQVSTWLISLPGGTWGEGIKASWSSFTFQCQYLLEDKECQKLTSPLSKHG